MGLPIYSFRESSSAGAVGGRGGRGGGTTVCETDRGFYCGGADPLGKLQPTHQSFTKTTFTSQSLVEPAGTLGFHLSLCSPSRPSARKD